MKECKCGCGGAVNAGRSYIYGHTRRGSGKYADLPTFLDSEDCDIVESRVYCIMKGRSTFYRVRAEWTVGKNGNEVKRLVYLHREIASRVLGRSLRRNELVDHKNGNGLDNTRDNLRVVTPAMNQQNKIRLAVNNSSGYRGVVWIKESGTWRAQAVMGGKNHIIGTFSNKEEADRAAIAFRSRNMPGYIAR